MGENTSIEWTDHTFNPWWGCAHVSPGCAHCYAETIANRLHPGHWGKTGGRLMQSEDYWKKPETWNRKAEKAGVRARVFCASMADVFEPHPDVVDSRKRLWDLIGRTPWLDWLLLTKRPGMVGMLTPPEWHIDGWPPNVWLGVSVEDQQRADERIPVLLSIPAAIRFLSCEPLLGRVDLGRWLFPHGAAYTEANGRCTCQRIDWVIVGGESGPKARPMHPEWARLLRDQCRTAGVPFLFKQWGAYKPFDGQGALTAGRLLEFPNDSLVALVRAGKKASGRVLDGREYTEFPPSPAADYVPQGRLL